MHWSRVGFQKAGSEGKAKKRMELMVGGKTMLGEIAWQWQMVVDGCQVPPPSFSFPTAIYPRCPAIYVRIKAYVYLDWACLANTIYLNYCSHRHRPLCRKSRRACQIRLMYRQCLSRTSPAATGYPHTTISLNSTVPTQGERSPSNHARPLADEFGFPLGSAGGRSGLRRGTSAV